MIKGFIWISIGLIVFILFFLVGCNKENVVTESKNINEINDTLLNPIQKVAEKQESFCNSPYIEFKKGECCLDNNSNKICDNDEIPKQDIENRSKSELKTNDSNKEYDENTLKVINSLKEKGLDVWDLDFVYTPAIGNFAKLYINAPGSDIDLNQIKLGFTAMYSMWGYNYSEYDVISDNEKNKHPQRNREVCVYWATKSSVRDAVEFGNWDQIESYCK